jgi:uncharacterized protein (TIGR02611 family)
VNGPQAPPASGSRRPTEATEPDGGRVADQRRPGLRERVAGTRVRRWLAAHRTTDAGYRLLVGLVGALVIAFGLATVPLPGPGWLTVIAGLFILATEFVWAERLLHFTRRQVRRWTEWVGARPLGLRLLLAGLTAAFVYGVCVLVLHLTGVPGWLPGWLPLWR